MISSSARPRRPGVLVVRFDGVEPVWLGVAQLVVGFGLGGRGLLGRRFGRGLVRRRLDRGRLHGSRLGGRRLALRVPVPAAAAGPRWADPRRRAARARRAARPARPAPSTRAARPAPAPARSRRASASSAAGGSSASSSPGASTTDASGGGSAAASPGASMSNRAVSSLCGGRFAVLGLRRGRLARRELCLLGLLRDLAPSRAERLFLLALDLFLGHSVPALQLEMLFDGIVEYAHRAKPYRGGAEGSATGPTPLRARRASAKPPRRPELMPARTPARRLRPIRPPWGAAAPLP